MSSRVPSLLRPRALAWLAAGLVGGQVAARLRHRLAGADGERPPEPARLSARNGLPARDGLPAPIVACFVLAACGLLTAGWLGWLAVQSRLQATAVAVALTGGDPDNAPALIRRYGCGGCHAIAGAPGADGQVAGPLTNMRARIYVAGVLPNTAANLIRWTVDPPAYAPRTAMPVTGITEAEARDVAAFLYGR